MTENLPKEELARIDDALYANTTSQWRKMAMVIGLTMMESGNPHNLPDIFFGERVRKLIDERRLEFQGELGSFRYCEVRRLE
jgi:Protein of unknown function